MFDPTKEVPNIELCKKLKELGYPQDKYGFWWVLFENDTEYDLCYWDEEHIRWSEKGNYILIGGCDCCAETLNIIDKIKAPTVRELGEIFMHKFMKKGCWEELWYWWFHLNEKRYQYDGNIVSEADTRAKSIIYWAENGFIDFSKIHNT